MFLENSSTFIFLNILLKLFLLLYILLYSPLSLSILKDKLKQNIIFNKYNIPTPDSGYSFSIQGFKYLTKNYFNKETVLKELGNYGGDGIYKYNNKESLVNSASKLLWKNEYCIFQKYINDSYGRSIRVLCINNKAVALAEYINKENSFISNNSFGYKYFDIVSLMNHPKRKLYSLLAEKAVNAIAPGNESTITGIDILDSPTKGPVVLEVNLWPDIFDIRQCTNIDGFDVLAKEIKRKIDNKI